MSGGTQGNGTPSLSGFPQVQNSAGGAQSAGANLPNASTMPDWQRGLLGAVTGSSSYGQNAPAINALFKSGMAMGQPQQGMAPPPMMRRPMMNTQIPQVGQGMSPPMQSAQSPFGLMNR